jgi:hypothetical protein
MHIYIVSFIYPTPLRSTDSARELRLLGDRAKQGRRVKWVERRVGSEADDEDDGGESGVGSNVNLLEMGTTKEKITALKEVRGLEFRLEPGP